MTGTIAALCRMRAGLGLVWAPSALLGTVMPVVAQPVPVPPAECARLGPLAQVSFRDRERQLLERVEEITRATRREVPPPALVAGAFLACRDQLRTRPSEGDARDAALRTRLLSGWTLWQDGARLHVQVGGSEPRAFPVDGPTARLADRVVSRLLVDLGLRDEAALTARRTFWFLWFEGYLAALGQRYDHYTYASELAAERASDRGRSFSIGAALAAEAGVVRIREVHDPQLGAQGVRAGDTLLALDGRDPAALARADWERYFLSRHPFDYLLSSSSAPRVRARALPKRHLSVVWGRLGRSVYARIQRFSRETEIELRRVLRQAVRDGAAGLILDLRQDSGGIASPGLVDFFFKPGQTIMSWKPTTEVQARHESATVEYYDLPLTVLTDGRTASMAEVLAAAVRQHRRGVLVGQRTLGKGVGQRVSPVLDEGELALVNSLYYYPGTTTTWNDEGIPPDIEVAPAGEDLVELLRSPVLDLERQVSMDAALKAALERQEDKP